jgi:hypothetical protein
LTLKHQILDPDLNAQTRYVAKITVVEKAMSEQEVAVDAGPTPVVGSLDHRGTSLIRKRPPP